MHIPEITLEGTPNEMGRAFGEAFRLQIQSLFHSRWTRLGEFVQTHQNKFLEWESFSLALARVLQSHQAYDRDLWEEFCGIAEGAAITRESLLVCMAYTDLRDYACTPLNSGCTSFLLPAALCADNAILAGQTWDMSYEALEYLVIVRRKPKGQPHTIALSLMGCFALGGLNEHGLAIGTTNLSCVSNNPGVNYLLTIQKALSIPTIETAVRGIQHTSRLSGHSFYVTDGQEGFNIETTSTQAAVTVLRQLPIVQTNHIIESALQPEERLLSAERTLRSGYRYGRMLAHLCDKKNWTMADCWAALGDETRSCWGGAICNEDFDRRYGEFATIATLVLNAKDRYFWVCAKGSFRGDKQQIVL